MKSHVIEKFKGMNTVANPLELGATAAVDARNVTLEGGRIRSYPPIKAFATATRLPRRLFAHEAANQVLVSEADGVNTTLEAFDSAGTSLATDTFASASLAPFDFVAFGTPAASRVYAVRDSATTTRRWDGAAWTSVAAVPSGVAIATMSGGTRLAVGQSAGNVHRVAFSDQGAPETFAAENFVDLAPGDGESVMALVEWNKQTFAFKGTKFAVFYGENTDDEGNTEFVHRMVEGRGTAVVGAATAAQDGVYFLANDGVYRTRGGPAELVSGDITTLWPNQILNDSPVTGMTLSNTTYPEIEAVRNAVYVSVGVDGVNQRMTLVLQDDQWTRLSVQTDGTSAVSGNFVSLDGRPIGIVSGAAGIIWADYTDAVSDSPLWEYQSGYYSLGSPTEKRLRFLDVYGYGSVHTQLLMRGQRSSGISDPGETITLGTLPDFDRARRRPHVRARLFAHRLSGGNAPAAGIHRVEHYYTESSLTT